MPKLKVCIETGQGIDPILGSVILKAHDRWLRMVFFFCEFQDYSSQIDKLGRIPGISAEVDLKAQENR